MDESENSSIHCNNHTLRRDPTLSDSWEMWLVSWLWRKCDTRPDFCTLQKDSIRSVDEVCERSWEPTDCDDWLQTPGNFVSKKVANKLHDVTLTPNLLPHLICWWENFSIPVICAQCSSDIRKRFDFRRRSHHCSDQMQLDPWNNLEWRFQFFTILNQFKIFKNRF
jgi:hypothetical protein